MPRPRCRAMSDTNASRGREAHTPREIPAKGWKDIAFRVKDEIAADHVSLTAAGVAFYGLLALFPAITALLAIGGLIFDPADLVGRFDMLRGIVPAQVLDIVTNQAEEVAGSQEGGLGLTVLVGIGLAIYSASKGMNSLIEGMNIAYDESETRGFFSKLMQTLGLTVMLVAGLLFALAAAGLVPAIFTILPLGNLGEVLATIATAVILALLTVFGIAVIYRYGPSRANARWRWIIPGAVVACVLWLIVSVGFAFYVSNFGSYNESFGTLAGVIVLLMWFWMSAFVILLGAELNSEMEAQTRHDSTTGPREPMGQRGAVKADTVGKAAD